MENKPDARTSLYNSIKAAASQKGFKKRVTKDYYYQIADAPSTRLESVGNLFDTLVKERGWKASVKAGSIFSEWERYVGVKNAQFTRPVSFTNGFLVVRCDSTARATQLRLMEYDFISAINDRLKGEMVKSVKFMGPQQPAWHKGVRTDRS